MLKLLGSELNDTVIVTDTFLKWLLVTKRGLSTISKNILWYCYIICDKQEFVEDLNIELDYGNIEELDEGYRITFNSWELNSILKTKGSIQDNTLNVALGGKNRTFNEIKTIVSELSSVLIQEVEDYTYRWISFSSTITYDDHTNTFSLTVNKRFIKSMRSIVELSSIYGRLQSVIPYMLTTGELMLYSWIVMNDLAIESQRVRGCIPYSGVSLVELCSKLGLGGSMKDNKKLLERYLAGINSKLNLNIAMEFSYKRRKLDRVRFYCEEGGVHVGKYFGKKKIDNGRPTNILVNLYKIKYENYYGCKLSEREESKLHFAIVEFFKSHSLDFKKEEDKDWFIDNVLDVLFERYDNLGYSTPDFPRFCANNLKTWVIDNIINEIPNKKKEDKNSLTGKVGTVPMEHQDWMDIDVSNVDDEEVF